jgi:hypothetical protein
VFTQIKSLTIVNRMQIAALQTLLCAASRNTFIISNRQNDAIDQVARTLMIDNGTWTKLGDGQETGPGELFITLLGASARNIGRER